LAGFPRSSELIDNWASVDLLIVLGGIAELLLRKRG
jgi:hypothetical protein